MKNNVLTYGARLMIALTLIVCAFSPVTSAFAQGAPEIDVLDQDWISIVDGDTTPSVNDHTDFGSRAVGNPQVYEYVVCNDGAADLNLTGTPLVALSGSSDFSVTQYPNTSTISSFDCADFGITFSPTTSGVKTATVSIANNDANENPYTFAITGNGIPPVYEIDVLDDLSWTSIVDGDSTPSTADNTDFGSVAITDGRAPYFSICNDGNTLLHLTGTPVVEITGSSDFSVTQQPSDTIAPSDCSNFDITFDPTILGVKTATVSIANNDPDENPYTFTVTANAIPANPEIDVLDSTLENPIANGDTTPSLVDGTDFGDVGTDDSSDREYYICNDGTTDLHVTDAEITGSGDFHIGVFSDTDVILPANCGYIGVWFGPSAMGVETATVSITSDDADENPYTFTISGNGVPPSPEIDVLDDLSGEVIVDGDTTPSLDDNTDFGDADVGVARINSYMVCNNGTIDLDLSGTPMVEITGSADFYVDEQPSGEPIGSGDCDFFLLAFAPTTLGVQTATVSIASNDLNENPYTFTIQGRGIGAVTLRSIGSQDGWVLESSETSKKGKSINNKATTCRIGDDAVKKQYVCILSFNTGSLPDDAIITALTLRVRKQSIAGGGNPVNSFQGFMVDIKNGLFGTAGLQASDFQAKGSKTVGPVKPPAISNWYTINLISSKDFINKLATNGGLTQIRLRFKLDDNNNAIANYLSVYTGNAGLFTQPELHIMYEEAP